MMMVMNSGAADCRVSLPRKSALIDIVFYGRCYGERSSLGVREYYRILAYLFKRQDKVAIKKKQNRG
jgi:hypothetical protein